MNDENNNSKIKMININKIKTEKYRNKSIE